MCSVFMYAPNNIPLDIYRKVTVMDISKKYGLDYRLLHTISTGQTWYGEWGYKFGVGSFGIDTVAYEDAIKTLSTIPISHFFFHTRLPQSQLKDTIAFYCSLSNHKILTVRDLFHFVLQLIHGSHILNRGDFKDCKKDIHTTDDRIICSLTKEDIQLAEETMIKVLRSVTSGHWVPWRALRGATYQVIGSPEVLDHCLKGLHQKVTGDGLVVALRCNPDTNTIEYRQVNLCAHDFY